MSTSSHRPDDAAAGRNDLETLSALVDGGLPADAARFAERRLAHDEAWRAATGRWQLIGDVLRGQPVAIAPAGFAEAVSARVAGDAAVARAAATSARRSAPFARWAGGGALAASLAVAGWIGLSPERAAPGQSSPAPVPSLAEAATPDPSAAEPAVPTVPVAPGPDKAAVAVATDRDEGRRFVASTPSPVAPPASTSRATPLETPPAEAPSGTPITVPTLPRLAQIEVDDASPSNPFNAPPVEPAARPWPRSTLPTLGTGRMNARFDAPSRYYPFEPRLPDAANDPPAPR